MITFTSQLDFEKAVMDVIKERISIHVAVDKVSDGDYYKPEQQTRVRVTLSGEYVGEIDSDTDKA